MIYVRRPAKPDVLNLDDPTSLGGLEYQRAINHFMTQEKGFEFTAYADDSVKDILIGMFNGKCAYCENYILGVSYGDIEHFRPKKAYNNKRGENLIYPGYYWLAMDWSNLLLSCDKCNRTYKKNLFPLIDAKNRKLKHDHNIVEEPLLIDPCDENDDPAQHIQFTTEGIIRFSSKKGETSIEVMGLSRTELTKQRERVAKEIEDKKVQLQGYLNSIYYLARIDVDDNSKQILKDNLRDLLACYNYLHNCVMNPEEPFQGMARQLAMDFVTDNKEVVERLNSFYEKFDSLPLLELKAFF